MRSESSEVKERIKAEFYARLLETSYNKITVKDIVASLGMSRQNFYRYYVSKEEILVDIVDDTFDRLYQILEINIDSLSQNSELHIDQLYKVLIPAKSIIGEVSNRGTDEVVFAHVQNFVRRVLGKMVRTRNIVVSDYDFSDALVAKISGGAFHMIKTWSQQEVEIDEEKLKALMLPAFRELIDNLDYLSNKKS